MKNTLFKFLKNLLGFLSKIGISKKTPGALRIYNFFHKVFWPYENIVDVQGSKMYVNPDGANFSLKTTLEHYAVQKIHEKTTTELFKKIIKKDDTVVDLGANIGYFTLLAAKLVGEKGKVYSFEPESQNYKYLKKNIEINDYHYVKAFQKAVSNKAGNIKFYVCPYDSGHHTINRFDGIKAYARGREVKKQEVEIDAVTLDNFLEEKKIDVIKMDVEGAEFLALEGMDQIIRNNDNLKMFVEFFPLLIENMGSSPREFIRKLLEDYNFSIFVIPDDYNAGKGEMMKVNSTNEIMEFCREKEDHINLFLKKGIKDDYYEFD